ncbi:capsular polysaccharide synthesis protein [Leuconostoc mesenteroides]|uniref:capsular polysaccharide synthesis protein n=1 Tax=Leuconostoc mesenteroides TaxID=1245 RepID=UPI0023603797|nr:capsular polysaccharide synthesis protein [Leuconostoc mesenteroides]
MHIIKNFTLYKIKLLSKLNKNSQKYRQQKVYNFLKDKIISQNIIKHANIVAVDAEKIPVWIFWAQGFDNAPVFIQENLRHTRKILSVKYDIRTVDLNDLLALINLSDNILKKYHSGQFKQAFFSDVVRFCLLQKYGGVWLDSTVYVTSSEIPNDIKYADHFIFKDMHFILNEKASSTGLIPGSSWFLFAKKDDEWVNQVAEFMKKYAENYNTVSYYYTTHLIMGLAFDINTDWYYKMPTYDNQAPHQMQYLMSNPYDEKTITKTLKGCFIHKLSYKQEFYSEIDKQLFMKRLFEDVL